MDNKIEIKKEDIEFVKETFKNGKETLQQINELGNLYNESKRIDNENLQIKHQIFKSAERFKQTQFVLEKIFDERRDIINKHFETIDKGMREGNDELIIAGLKSVSSFVASNPFSSFESFENMLFGDDSDVIELDF